MNDEEILEDIENVEEGSSELSSEEASHEDISDEEILDAVREVIYENMQDNIEGDNLQLLSDNSPSVSPAVEVDYTQLLTDIKMQQIQTNSSLSTIIESQEQTIFDKPLSDYSIVESILVFLVVFGLASVFVGFIKKFTPKLWR